MSRSDALDSRDVLVWYQRLTLIAGLVIVFIRWPMPASFGARPLDTAAFWSAVVISSAAALWLSGLAALGMARIENADVRRRTLRWFGFTLMLLPLIVFLNGFGFADRLPGVFLWTPLVIGMALTALTTDMTPRRPLVPSSLGFRSTVLREKSTLRGQFEESIRQAARQEERARLARELHDAVKQQLFVIQTAAATAETRFDGDQPGAREALTQVRASARDALTEMEVMLEQLQAVPLGNAGLIESLKRQCDVVRFRTGADVSFETGELPSDGALDPGAHQAMLRFAQEALANVARHARASHVSVSLKTENDIVVLAVTDDGQGFDLKQPPVGIGLTSMSARAAEAGGVLEIKSTPGEGTTVRLLAPTAKGTRWQHKLSTLVGIGFLALFIALAYFDALGYIGAWARGPWVAMITIGSMMVFRSALAWWRASR